VFAMVGASLLVFTLCAVVSVHAGRIGVGSFYPVLDDAYASHSVPLATHKSYGEEQSYGDYHDGGHRTGGAGYGSSVHDADYYADAGKKGNTGRESLQGYDHNQKSQRRNQEDQGYYGDVSAVKSGYDDGRAYHGGQNYGQQGRNTQSFGTRGGHKKGHHTTGFTNSYHKDESGKKSEFFDSLNDEGDHYNYKGEDDGYSRHGTDAYRGGHQGSAYATDARGKQGHYGAGSALEDSRGSKGDYGRQEYYDRQADYAQKAGHDASRRGGGYYDGGAKHSLAGGHATAGFYGGGGHHAAPYY
jgi:hypothetical protein